MRKLGILLKAKQQGWIKEIHSLLPELKRNDFYISSVVGPTRSKTIIPSKVSFGTIFVV